MVVARRNRHNRLAKGHAGAMFALGAMYGGGHNIPIDRQAALRWFRAAADPAIIEKREVYRLLTGAVVPRPIGWASTVSKSGFTNLAPFSFFTAVCIIPPMISLTIARNPEPLDVTAVTQRRDLSEQKLRTDRRRREAVTFHQVADSWIEPFSANRTAGIDEVMRKKNFSGHEE